MNPKSKSFLVLAVLAASACASSSTASAPAPEATATPAAASSTPTPAATESAAVASATFTDAQADRGRDLFRAQCTECHYSSEFSDSQFRFKWSRRSAGNLYTLINTSMPETAPGSLTPEETVDLVTYILRMNGFEPGASELSPDEAVLDGISLASIRSE